MIEALRENLTRLPPHDRVRNRISPAESSRNPAVTLAARSSILTRAYVGEYPADVSDLERSARQVRDGNELIWFWGPEAEIAELRGMIASGDARDVPELALGTTAVLAGERELGPGFGDACRAASMDRVHGARAFLVDRTLGYLDGRERTLRERYHMLIVGTRTRKSEPGVRGGEAMHRIQVRYISSRYWGWIPQYIGQGGILELGEIRGIDRDPDAALAALRHSDPWYFADDEEAAFAGALCQMNHGRRPQLRMHQSRGAGASPIAHLVLPASAELAAVNHGSVRQTPNGQPGLPMLEAIERLLESGACSAVAHIRLDDPGLTGLQTELGRLGFKLTAVVPPRAGLPPHEVWSRPRPGLAIAPAYYAQEMGATAAESAVLDYARRWLAAAA